MKKFRKNAGWRNVHRILAIADASAEHTLSGCGHSLDGMIADVWRRAHVASQLEHGSGIEWTLVWPAVGLGIACYKTINLFQTVTFAFYVDILFDLM